MVPLNVPQTFNLLASSFYELLMFRNIIDRNSRFLVKSFFMANFNPLILRIASTVRPI